MLLTPPIQQNSASYHRAGNESFRRSGNTDSSEPALQNVYDEYADKRARHRAPDRARTHSRYGRASIKRLDDLDWPRLMAMFVERVRR